VCLYPNLKRPNMLQSTLAVLTILLLDAGKVVEAEQECYQRRTHDEWSEELANANCSPQEMGQTNKKWGPDGARVCTGANEAEDQIDLETSLANAMYFNCANFCVYSYKTMPQASAAFKYQRGAKDCWTRSSVNSCMSAQSDIEAVVEKYNKIGDCPTMSPSSSPTNVPTADPTPLPTADPTKSMAPTPAPSDTPTADPTADPTFSPTRAPTANPSDIPTPSPTPAPTVCEDKTLDCVKEDLDCYAQDPNARALILSNCPKSCGVCDGATLFPSVFPTFDPTAEPTKVPSPIPTADPTIAPTATPSEVPTVAPSDTPTKSPTDTPTVCADTDLACSLQPWKCYEKNAIIRQDFQNKCPVTCGTCDGATMMPTQSPIPTPDPTEFVGAVSSGPSQVLAWWGWLIIGVVALVLIILMLLAVFKPRKLRIATPKWRDPPAWWRQKFSTPRGWRRSTREPARTGGAPPGTRAAAASGRGLQRFNSEEDVVGEAKTPKGQFSTNRAGEGEASPASTAGDRTQTTIRRNVTGMSEGAAFTSVKTTHSLHHSSTTRSVTHNQTSNLGELAEQYNPDASPRATPGGIGDGKADVNVVGAPKASMWIVNRTVSGRIKIEAVDRKKVNAEAAQKETAENAEPLAPVDEMPEPINLLGKDQGEAAENPEKPAATADGSSKMTDLEMANMKSPTEAAGDLEEAGVKADAKAEEAAPAETAPTGAALVAVEDLGDKPASVNDPAGNGKEFAGVIKSDSIKTGDEPANDSPRHSEM